MLIEIKVPSPGESISEAELFSWLAADGSMVEKGQEIAEIESDKATLAISAEATGVLHILVPEGSKVKVGAVIATIDADATQEVAPSVKLEIKTETPGTIVESTHSLRITPLAKSVMEEKHINEAQLKPLQTEKRIMKKDILQMTATKETAIKYVSTPEHPLEVVKMSTLRKKIAERLVAVKNKTAMLTTFNEVDMTGIYAIRDKYKEIFMQKHGVKLGFMSFFSKACEMAIREVPVINAMIDEDKIILFKYVDLAIAVSTPKGLMTPVVRGLQALSFAQIEIKIAALATKARDMKITPDDLMGGTFTITNGGVFGSLMSTPILNPPQSAILGMHKVMDRPVAINGKVEIRPMMYIALSYDHRIIDGKESVGFIVKVKELLENPALMFEGKNVEVALGL